MPPNIVYSLHKKECERAIIERLLEMHDPAAIAGGCFYVEEESDDDGEEEEDDEV